MRRKVCGSDEANHNNIRTGPAVYHARPMQIHSNSSNAKKQKEQHICTKCNSSFLHARHLEKHIQGHERNDCKQCNELFSSRKKLILHMREKHGKRLYDTKIPCKYCGMEFTRRQTLHAHYKIHAEGQEVCQLCGDFFADSKEINNHMKTHDDTLLSCPLCHQTFSRQQQYARHMQDHDKYRCLTCDQGFSAWKVLLQHQLKGHEISKPPAAHQCSMCSKTFQRKRNLQAHVKQHSQKSVFPCDLCNEKFSSMKSLGLHFTTEKHLSKVTTEGQGYMCEKCGKHFLQPLSLSTHRLRNHSLEKKVYSCDFCSHTTHFKANLMRHIRLHLNERRFVCEQCGAAFYVLSALKDHCLYLHSDARNHECDKCNKKFKRSSELKRHLRTHSDERPHVCDCCERTFKRTWHLKRHKEKFHNEINLTRQVQRLRQDDTGTFHPVPKEVKSKKKSIKVDEATKTTCSDSNAYVILPYEDIVSLKQLSEDGTCKDVSTLSLSSQDLTNVSNAHYLLSAQQLTSDTNLLYLATTSVQNISQDIQNESDLSKPLVLRDGEALDLLKHRHYQSSNEMSSHMMLAPHDAAMRNVLGADVKLSDSMIEDVAEPRQPSPGRDSPLCMADLVRLQDSSLFLQ